MGLFGSQKGSHVAEFFCHIKLSPCIFRKQIEIFVWLVFENKKKIKKRKKKWILKSANVAFLKKIADLHQVVTFLTSDYLQYLKILTGKTHAQIKPKR